MIPTLAAPNIQVAPPVDASVFTAPAEPAIGRLPLHIVPPPVTSPKVADNRTGQQTSRQPAAEPAAGNAAPAFYMPASGTMSFESPYSTTFVAQLFGQFVLSEDDGLIGGLLDFEQLARFNLVKYKPSLAFRPRATPQPAPEPALPQPDLRTMPVASSDAPPAAPAMREEKAPELSIFTSGLGAYGATQNRNDERLVADARPAAEKAEVSLVS